jgi:hypothetical protein
MRMLDSRTWRDLKAGLLRSSGIGNVSGDLMCSSGQPQIRAKQYMQLLAFAKQASRLCCCVVYVVDVIIYVLRYWPEVQRSRHSHRRRAALLTLTHAAFSL